jgi:glycosyltransferase involved in cell wall biosynthesis
MNTSIIIETFNYLEGSSLQELRAAILAASAYCRPGNETEILLVDASGDPKIKQMIHGEFPLVRCLDAVGLGYDQAKMLAAKEARGQIVAYLDGDCVPLNGWLEKLTEPIASGSAVASAGFSRYRGGFFSSILSIMDFGFLLPRSVRKLGCYAFHNVAFLRDTLLHSPLPDGPLRCACYPHAQKLLRARTPVVMAPDAVVFHGLPPTLRERMRQGYDAVAVCWVDTDLKAARKLRMGILAALLFYAVAIKFDWKRARSSYKEFEFRRWQMFLALPIFPALRLIDLVGMSGALVLGPKSRRWLDWSVRRYVTP